MTVNNSIYPTIEIEGDSKTVFVTTMDKETLFHEEVVESESIRVDFSKVFP